MKKHKKLLLLLLSIFFVTTIIIILSKKEEIEYKVNKEEIKEKNYQEKLFYNDYILENTGNKRSIKEISKKEYISKSQHHKLNLPEEDEVISEEEFMDAIKGLENSSDITKEEQKIIERVNNEKQKKDEVIVNEKVPEVSKEVTEETTKKEENEKEEKQNNNRETEIENVILNSNINEEIASENKQTEIKNPVIEETKKSTFPTNPDEIDYSRGVGLRYNSITKQWEQYYLDE